MKGTAASSWTRSFRVSKRTQDSRVDRDHASGSSSQSAGPASLISAVDAVRKSRPEKKARRFERRPCFKQFDPVAEHKRAVSAALSPRVFAVKVNTGFAARKDHISTDWSRFGRSGSTETA
ncbi:MAG: hypothetical protein ACOC0V_02895 [Oceanicaulis sp.]